MGNIPLPALNIRPPEKGPDPLEQYARTVAIQNAMQEGQLRQQQAQMGNIQLQQAQIQLQDQQKLQQIMSDQTIPWNDPEQAHKQLFSKAQQAGVSYQTLQPMYQQQLKEQQEIAATHAEELKSRVTEQDLWSGRIGGVLAITDPALKQQAKAQLIAAGEKAKLIQPGTLTPDTLDDNTLQAMQNGFQLGSAQIKNDLKRRQIEKPTEATLAVAAAKGDKDAEAALGKLRRGPEAEQPVGDDKIPQFNQLLASRWQVLHPNVPLPASYTIQPGATQKDFDRIDNSLKSLENMQATKEQRDFSNGIRSQMLQIAQQGASVANGLNQAALDQAAERYAATGVLPPTGFGKGGIVMRQQIMNRAAELHPKAELAANSAEYAANKTSLANVQKLSDAVGAFEKTAGKNLDQFLQTAQKVVDTGSPLLNTPVRFIAKGMGGTNQPVFDAARTVAVAEISKVLNSANASAVVSDAARKEVNDLIAPNATLPQIVKAAKILRTDMKNRSQAYDEQISDIKSRLGGATQGGEAKSAAGGPPAGATHVVKDKSGKVIGYTSDGKTMVPVK